MKALALALAAFALSACGEKPRGTQVDAKAAPPFMSVERLPAITPELRRMAADRNRPTPPHSVVEIPFHSLRSAGAPARLLVGTRKVEAKVVLADGRTLRFGRPGVPVKLLDLPGGHLWVVFRGFPDNHLELALFPPRSERPVHKSLGAQEDGYLFFRAAAVRGNKVWLAIYDNRRQTNIVRLYQEGMPGEDVVLPLLEDPAGGTYEMEPPLFLLPDDQGGLRIIGGTLDATLSGSQLKVERRAECTRTLEAVNTPEGVAILCELKAAHAPRLFRVAGPRELMHDFHSGDGIPWNLRWESGRLEWSLARTAQERGALFEFDLTRGQNSGLMELGSNNVEGRIAWSQIYYLNGFLDLLRLAEEDARAFEVFGDFVAPLRRRLDVELALLDEVLSSPGYYRSRAFTVKREPALFAVQTSRLLDLLERQVAELPGAVPARNLKRVREDVLHLRGHIEQVATEGEDPRWIPRGRRHLRWPRGSAFPFDGLPVPFNHQNEWAWSVFEAARRDPTLGKHPAISSARDIILTFNDLVLRRKGGGGFPSDARWQYWWGRAYDGWKESDGVSVNRPAYAGDHILAWISFRTIDLVSVLAALDFMPELDRTAVLGSAAGLVARGGVYPFAAGALARHKRYPVFAPEVAVRYSRSGPPSDIASSVWALARHEPP